MSSDKPVSPHCSLPARKRDPRLDNLRGALILCVLLGHLLELWHGTRTNRLYTLLYSFHMPFFMFLTGYLAGSRPRKLLKHIFLPYLVFQTLYTLFDFYILRNGETFTLQFVYPYWLLWYLPAVGLSTLALPVLETSRKVLALAEIAAAILVALLCGFDANMGYYLSLSRAVVFFPFFLAGHFCAGTLSGEFHRLTSLSGGKRIAAALLLFAAAVGYILALFRFNVPQTLLYGSYSYASCGGAVWQRLLMEVGAFVVIALGFCLMPGRKLPLLSGIGANTLPVYLLHGFCVRLAGYYGLFRFSGTVNLLLAALLALLMALLFSAPPVRRVFRKLF